MFSQFIFQVECLDCASSRDAPRAYPLVGVAGSRCSISHNRTDGYGGGKSFIFIYLFIYLLTVMFLIG